MSDVQSVSSVRFVQLADALDLPEEVKAVQDAYWQARREWTELQNAYLTVIGHMTGIHDDFVEPKA